ncbi:arginine-tRNA-protein transferase 1 [Lojkania enalia]|uniref:arginyltransferase n=1 Tax=Lojkania enalia TaxID=147567 RepID=A0A9P4K5G6_9PLEO|nr:arginine-tRNA-protein transferase 1 [Didymosphaeria enalia]
MSFLARLGYSAESCGYCKDASTGRRTPNSRASYYLSSNTLSVDVYQALVDRGWRRSGTVFYKPDVLRHCCPHYTIRLPVAEFKASREHRHAINKWNRYVLGDEYIREATKRYPKSKEEKARLRNSFDLAAAVHESEYANLKRPPEPAHRFEVILEPDDFTQEKYELFKNYQQHVHHEHELEISERGFERFLCGSPLHRTNRTVNGKSQHLGSYHQCYRLDGRLVAMGVLDLLPHCVSGVYFIYHSDFDQWSFGKLSAIRETVLTLEGEYQYYYMGFYIHSCAKMRYKGEYKPSYILDPESYEWNPLDGEVRQLLDVKPYVSLARERRLKQTRSTSDTTPEGMSITESVSEKDDYFDYPISTAAEAAEAVKRGLSLFDLKVPGLMTVDEIEQDIRLDEQPIRLMTRAGLMTFQAQDLKSWGKGNMRKSRTFKGFIAELVACIGPEAAREVVIDYIPIPG